MDLTVTELGARHYSTEAGYKAVNEIPFSPGAACLTGSRHLLMGNGNLQQILQWEVHGPGRDGQHSPQEKAIRQQGHVIREL